MKIPLRLCCLAFLLPAVPSCTSPSKKKETEESLERSNLGDPTPALQNGSYYKLRGMMNGFFEHVPNFTDVLPDHYLGHNTIVQLLDANAGDGWARVKEDKWGIGYTKFSNLKIVPFDQQPKPKYRDPDDELDRRMSGR